MCCNILSTFLASGVPAAIYTLHSETATEARERLLLQNVPLAQGCIQHSPHYRAQENASARKSIGHGTLVMRDLQQVLLDGAQCSIYYLRMLDQQKTRANYSPSQMAILPATEEAVCTQAIGIMLPC